MRRRAIHLIALIAVVAATLAVPVQTAFGGVERHVEGDTTSLIATNPHEVAGFAVSPCAPAPVQVHNCGGLTFGHGARHLSGTGIGEETAETAISQAIRQSTSGASATGSFWGRVTVVGRQLEYRAFTRPDGTINIGTYYPIG